MDKQLNAQQIEEAKRVFRLFDRDGNGVIDIKELGNAFQQLGQRPTDDQIKHMIRDIDTNRNDALELDEFLKLLQKSAPANSAEKQLHLLQSFKTFDRNGDGYITKDEFKKAMQNFGQEMSEEEVAQVMKDGDVDGDGRINYAEFIKLMS